MSSAPVTIVAVPKPFCGHIAVIQRNAIESWTKLVPRPDIFLFGDEDGTAQCAAGLAARHFPGVARNRFGTPLLSDVFRQTDQAARTSLVAYVNADIILPATIGQALATIQGSFPEFLAVGRRTNLDVREPLDFSENWQTSLWTRAAREGRLNSHTGIDFFVFPRGFYADTPPLAVGRAWFDQWCIKSACARHVPVVDVTRFVPVLHQDHDYSHVSGGQPWAYGGDEARENLAIYGERPHTYTILSATHVLTRQGRVRRAFFRSERLAARTWMWKLFVEKTYPLRKRLGLSNSARRVASVKG